MQITYIYNAVNRVPKELPNGHNGAGDEDHEGGGLAVEPED